MKKLMLALFITAAPINACVLDKIEDKLVNNRVTECIMNTAIKHPGKTGLAVGTVVGGVLTYWLTPQIEMNLTPVLEWGCTKMQSTFNWIFRR